MENINKNKVKLRVPATTANIGPGFDSLGCALTMYNYFTFEKIEEGIEFEGCPEEFCNDENLAYQSYKAAMKYMGKEADGIKITIESHIPICRGLGSSAAMLVAGATAASVLQGDVLTKEEILDICNVIEGHPDNLAPAIYGGLTASMTQGENAYIAPYELSKDLHFCALVPNFETSTHDARKVLPNEVSYSDAIFNVTRVAVLLKALEEGDTNLIALAIEDKLHQPYRKDLIFEYEDVKNICKSEGAEVFFISGSGSTCMCLSKDEMFADKLAGKFDQLTKEWRAIPLMPDNEGVKILEV